MDQRYRVIEPPRSNPLAGPEPTAPPRPPEPTSNTKARPGLRRQFANARSLVSGGLRADLSRIPTPGNLRAAGSGLISIGLERFAAGNPLWTLFLSRLPFKGRTRQAIQAACGGSSCCGCSSCTSCGGACFSPPGWIALAIVGVILVFSVIFNTRPSFTLPLLCERGDTSACAMLGSGGSVTLSVSPEEIPSGAIDGYQRIEEQTGVPWFYLLAWEKVASDFGRADFTFQRAPAPPGDALSAEANEVRREINSLTANDSQDGADTADNTPIGSDPEQIRIDIERESGNFIRALTSTLRGGSFGYHLLTRDEYQARGVDKSGSADQLRNPWNRFDSGRILAESLLDIYSRIASEEKRFVAPIDRQTISPPNAPILNELVEALIEEEAAEGHGGIEDVIQWTPPSPFLPHSPHFSPCNGPLCVGDGADWKATWPNPSDMVELPPPPPDGGSNLYTSYEKMLYQDGGTPIKSDERYYLCRRLADARAEGRLGAENYRRSLTLPDEGLRDELAEQCEIFLSADQSVAANNTEPAAPGSSAEQLGDEFAKEIADYYESSLRNPEILPGEEVKDWKRLKIVMGAIVADRTAWGAETGAFFSVDRSVQLTDGKASGESLAPDEVRRTSIEVSAYAEAINSYAESIYRAWTDARGLRDSTKSPERRAADADALFAAGAIDRIAEEQGIEPIYLAATLAADGLFASDARRSVETGIDAGGCRPYTSVGSSDGSLNGTNAPIIYARAVGVVGLSDAGVPAEYRDQILSFAQTERLDPLLLASIAQVASNWSAGYDSGDELGHAGLTGLLRNDERAYLAAFDPPDRFNTVQAITGGSRKAYKLISGHGLKIGLASYWAGVEASALAGSSFARFPKSAQDFANDVISEYRRLAGLDGQENAVAGDAQIGSSGIGGCWRFGAGLAVSYAPSGGPLTVAMNHCIASRRGECGQVEISVPGSTKKVIADVVDYLDGDQGTADQRWIAIGPAVTRQLGLTGSAPWKVTLRLIDPAGEDERPDRVAVGKEACRARSRSSWPRAALFTDVEAAIDWTARCLVAADARLEDISVRLTDPGEPPVEEGAPLRRWGRLDGPWAERSGCIGDRKPRSEVDPVYPLVTFTAPSWCDYRQIILSESRQRVLALGLLGGGTLYGDAPVSALGFSWPVADAFITSGWLPREQFPGSVKIVTKGKTIYPHAGIDMRSDQGTGVDMAGRGLYATADGWLSWSVGGEELGTCNNVSYNRRAAWLLIYHDSGIVSRYVHLELAADGSPLLPENIRARLSSSDDAIAKALEIPAPPFPEIEPRAVRVSRGELIGWYWKELCHLHYEVWAGRIGPSGDVRRFGLDPVATYYGSKYESFPRVNRFDPLELLPQGGGKLGWATDYYERWWGGYPPPFNLAAEQDRLFPAPP